MIILVSLIASGPLFFSLKEYTLFVKKMRNIGAKEGDHLTMMNIYIFWKKVKSKEARARFCNEYKVNERALLAADKMIDRLKSILRQLGHKVSESDDDTETLLRCLTTGFFMNAA